MDQEASMKSVESLEQVELPILLALLLAAFERTL